jgi:hypothetical protein
MSISTHQALDLAAALVFAEAAVALFNEHRATTPAELVFARYNAGRSLDHIRATVNGLSAADMADVEVNALRLRVAAEAT